MSGQIPEPGIVVGGRYRLDSRIGDGGMAVVWKAVHTETDRAVALKLVRRELAADEQAREMFVREARIAARIGRSEHIVDVLDAGVDPGLGLPFLAMELLDGEPLDERLRRDGPLSPDVARLVLEQLAEALDQAHEAKVVHRDLKPQNLFLTRTKRGALSVKVLDFGIAKIAEHASQGATQVGTPAYGAPEQLGPTWRAMGERNGKRIAETVSPATDVWAFGIVAYEMYTGARSGEFWDAKTIAEVPLKIVMEALPTATVRAGAQASRLPAGFDVWLSRCLELDAERRFPSAGEAVRSLFGGPAAHGTGVAAPGASAGAAHAAASVAAAASAFAPTEPPVHAPAAPPAAARPGSAPPVGSWPAVPPVVRAGGDVQVYRAWQQFRMVPSIAAVRCEAQTQIGDAKILVGEIVSGDEVLRAIGESNFLLALVTCPRIHYRVGVRARQSAGIGDSLTRGFQALDALVSSQPKALRLTIGDPWFEARYELRADTANEAHHALPAEVRKWMMQRNFMGVLETRQGGLVVAQLDRPRLDMGGLDHVLSVLEQMLAAFG